MLMRSFIIAVLVAIALALAFALVLNSIQETTELAFTTEGVRLDGVHILSNEGTTRVNEHFVDGGFIILGAIIAAVFGYIGAVRAAKVQVRALEDQRGEEHRRFQQTRHQKKYEMALALRLEARRLSGAAEKRIVAAQVARLGKIKYPIREQMTISVFPLIRGERGDIGLLGDELQDKVLDLVSEVDDYNAEIETLPRTPGGPVGVDQPTEEKLIRLKTKADSVVKDLSEFITRVRDWRCKKCEAFIDEILDVSEDGKRAHCPICNNETRIAQARVQIGGAPQLIASANVVKSGSATA